MRSRHRVTVTYTAQGDIKLYNLCVCHHIYPPASGLSRDNPRIARTIAGVECEPSTGRLEGGQGNGHDDLLWSHIHCCRPPNRLELAATLIGLAWAEICEQRVDQ